MPKRDRQTNIRSCVERFAADLTDIVARAALEDVLAAFELGASSQGLAARGSRRTGGDRRPSMRAPLVSRTTASALPESDVPISLDAYERQAILRALDENGGIAIAAGAALGLSKAGMYRHMDRAGIPRTGRVIDIAEFAPNGYLRLDGPVSMDAYERRVLQRAIGSCGGDKRAAARVLGIGLSTIYRRCDALGLA